MAATGNTEARIALRPAEAARLVGIGKNAVYRLVASGEIPATSLDGRRILIPRAALEAYILSRARQEAAERRRARWAG